MVALDNMQWHILDLGNMFWQILVVNNMQWQTVAVDNIYSVYWQIVAVDSKQWHIVAGDNMQSWIVAVHNMQLQIGHMIINVNNMHWQILVVDNLQWHIVAVDNMQCQLVVAMIETGKECTIDLIQAGTDFYGRCPEGIGRLKVKISFCPSVLLSFCHVTFSRPLIGQKYHRHWGRGRWAPRRQNIVETIHVNDNICCSTGKQEK